MLIRPDTTAANVHHQCLVVLGASTAGKSALVRALTIDTSGQGFARHYEPTLGAAVHEKVIAITAQSAVHWAIVDTSGRQIYEQLVSLLPQNSEI